MRKVPWFLLFVLSLATVGGIVYANVHSVTLPQASTSGYTCPLTGEELPCPNCCPLNGGQAAKPYVCPLTGEDLPCSKCCPLDEGQQSQGFICPVTEKELPCPNCCPLKHR
jgi:hypothetical protein